MAGSLPQITTKAVVLGIVLAVVLGGANTYLGLMAGMTVSASIPAAVISMAVLRLFKRSNILENNQVQTAASAGESLAAGVLFTMPALVLLGAWQSFDYVRTTTIAMLGGLLGVLFTVPLRRPLIVESKLAFPEGVATAQVLKVGASGGSLRSIVAGGLIGAMFTFGQMGLGLWTGKVWAAARLGPTVVYGAVSASPALVAVDYIVGLNIAVLVFLGGAVNWLITIPILAAFKDIPASQDAGQVAWELWKQTTRHIGVGAMIVGGAWALLRLVPTLLGSIRGSTATWRATRRRDTPGSPAEQRELPMPWIGLLVLLALAPLYLVLRTVVEPSGLALIMAAIMLIAAFAFSAVASYMAGLVGSSNNPISGVTIATLLGTALLLMAFGVDRQSGPQAAILIGAVVCCAAAIGGDNTQDLKTGYLVGATPWKQQVMQTTGVVAMALCMAPLLQLLHGAYGIGGEKLPAPQATLMKAIVQGVFERNLPWLMIGIGAAVAVCVIVVDVVLELRRTRLRLPVLAVAVGLYLPLHLGSAIFVGGLVAWLVRRGANHAQCEPSTSNQSRGVLFASGLITGEALLGIVLAVPIMITSDKNLFEIKSDMLPLMWPAALWLAIVVWSLYANGRRRPRQVV